MAEDRMLNDEILLGLIKANAGGGTTNYNSLSNKPQIAGTELQGNKSLADLGIASAQSVSNITNGESIDNFAGVENALEGKQDALTAGDYIEIDGNEISVNPVVPNENVTYEFKTKDASGGDATVTLIKKSGDTVISSTDYRYESVMGNKYITVDDLFYFGYSTTFTSGSEWGYKLLAASADHAVNYTRTWAYDATVDYTENFTSIDHSGESLVLKAQMDTALSGKQDALTFDDTPTNGSNNPVKSNGIYDALATKADTDMVAADFNAAASYTAGNYCVQDGKLYKFKNNHSGAWSSADVDEVKITGELSSLRSGLTSVTDVDITEITLETGISWGTSKSSNMKKRCGQLYGNLYFNGLLDMTTSPYKKIGVISSQYRPLADSRMPVYLQTGSDIVIGVLAVFVTGSIFIIAPKGNYGKGDGIDANSWCTSDGVYINMLV